MKLTRIILAGLVLFILAGRVWSEPPQRFEFTQRHMAVDVRLTLYAGEKAAANDAAARGFARIAELDKVFSDFDAESEVSRLCRDAQPDGPVRISRDLFTVLQASCELSKRSNGAFDVTIAPVVKLWRRSRRQKQLPDPKLLNEALKTVGYRQLVLNAEQQSVTFNRAGIQLGFGGIAKGYAAQEALKTLKAAGVPRALVAIAGDIAAGDAPPDAPGWKIAIAPFSRDPQGSAAGNRSKWLRLANAAVSTAGDAYQFVEIDGVRYSHIVDPKTGLGLTRSTSVTVIAKDGLMADGLDTTANLLGPEAGLRLVRETPNAEGLFATMNGDQVEVRTTPGFDAWLWRE